MNEFYKTRDAVLGVEDVLNIQNSVHLYSSKHATLTEEEKHAEVEKYYRDLSLILADESRLEKFHVMLYQLDQHVIENSQVRIDPVYSSTYFAQNQVTLPYQDTTVTIYVFQVGAIRFLKEIKWG